MQTDEGFQHGYAGRGRQAIDIQSCNDEGVHIGGDGPVWWGGGYFFSLAEGIILFRLRFRWSSCSLPLSSRCFFARADPFPNVSAGRKVSRLIACVSKGVWLFPLFWSRLSSHSVNSVRSGWVGVGCGSVGHSSSSIDCSSGGATVACWLWSTSSKSSAHMEDTSVRWSFTGAFWFPLGSVSWTTKASGGGDTGTISRMQAPVFSGCNWCTGRWLEAAVAAQSVTQSVVSEGGGLAAAILAQLCPVAMDMGVFNPLLLGQTWYKWSVSPQP
jgi:hypothetical protein